MLKIDTLLIENEALLVSPNYFFDMGLDSCKKILADSEFDVFFDTLCRPLTNIVNIYERQNIIKDFLKYPTLLSDIQKISDCAKNNKFVVHDFVYSRISPKRKLIENLRTTNKSIDAFHDMLAVMRNKHYTSKTLSEFCKYLNNTEVLYEIKQKINTIANWLLTDSIAFKIQFASEFKLHTAQIVCGGNSVEHDKRQLIKKKKNTVDNEEFEYGLDFILELQVETLIERGIQNLHSIISNINSYILSFFSKLSRELLFYSAVLKIINFSKDIKCDTFFPRFESKCICATGLYDLGLLFNDECLEKVVSNDFTGSENTFYFISGSNQGGKTTFLKSIGIAQIFAQNGLPVFATKYICPIYYNFASHFPNDEDMTLTHGKLEEELTRFYDLLPFTKHKALVLLNESFSTTTEKEGCAIAVDVLRALDFVSPTLFFVTHNYLILKKAKYIGFENIKTRSLIVLPGKSVVDRTYSIVFGEPQPDIYGLDYILEHKNVSHTD